MHLGEYRRLYYGNAKVYTASVQPETRVFREIGGGDARGRLPFTDVEHRDHLTTSLQPCSSTQNLNCPWKSWEKIKTTASWSWFCMVEAIRASPNPLHLPYPDNCPDDTTPQCHITSIVQDRCWRSRKCTRMHDSTRYEVRTLQKLNRYNNPCFAFKSRLSLRLTMLSTCGGLLSEDIPGLNRFSI